MPFLIKAVDFFLDFGYCKVENYFRNLDNIYRISRIFLGIWSKSFYLVANVKTRLRDKLLLV